jgi:hypothetical protein
VEGGRSVNDSLTSTESFALDALSIREHALRNGWPDFLVDLNGVVFAAEVKFGSDVVAPHQRAVADHGR